MAGGFGPEGPHPSIVQWRLTLEESASSIQIDIAEMFDLLEQGVVDANLEVLLKPGSEPILWTLATPEEERTADQTMSAPFVFTQDDEGLVSGRAVVQGPFEPGEYHLQLAGRDLLVGLKEVAVTALPAGQDAGPVEPDAAVDPGDDDGADDTGDMDGESDEGGGCRTAPSHGTGGAAILLLAALWLLGRRKAVAPAVGARTNRSIRPDPWR